MFKFDEIETILPDDNDNSFLIVFDYHNIIFDQAVFYDSSFYS